MTETVDRATLRAELLRRRLRGDVAPRREDRIPRVPRGGPLPVSYAQRRMWLLDRLTPGGTEYLMTTALRLCGPLDVTALRAALDGLVARHEVLRTRYEVVDGEPAQIIDAPGPVALAEVDLTALDGAERERRLAALTTTEREPIDLATGPVFRPALVRLGDEEHALVLTLHHIASDGWSEEVLIRELGTAYAGTPLAAPPVQYADVAVWQRAHRSGDALAGRLEYWRDRLAGLTPLELPTDRPRPPVRDAAGDRVTFTVPASVAVALGRLGREHRATPFMVLLAAFQVLLSRYSGQTDIAVGTPVAGRDRPEVQDLVGLFLNTLVLRTDLSGGPSFTEVLDRVRVAALDAYANQDLPFETVVDALSPERDPARNPLFDAMFLWQDAGSAIAPMGPLTVEEIEIGETAAKFDLTMAVTERADGSLSAGVDYATALFDRATVERLTGHFVRLLASIAAAPKSPVGELELLSPHERRRLAEWNDTAVPYATGTLPGLFTAQVARTPSAAAVRCEGAEVSYAELDRRANRLAHHLIEHGVGPESVVGVCLDRSVDLIVALLGVHKAGAAYLPLDPDHPAERRAYLCADSGARVVLTAETFTDLSGPDHDPGVAVLPEHPAYVIYTSGSTGRPKGVVVEHRGIVNRLQWMQQEYGLTGTDRILQKTPATFDVSVWEFFWPLITGATLIVAKPDGHRDPAYLADLILRERITTVHFVPSMLRAFLTEPFGALPSLRRMICSGEALPADLVTGVHERIGCRLDNLYGPTEASVDVTATQCRPGEPVTIGHPIANTRTHILDAHLRPVPVGVPGELMLAGVQLARGYLNKPALTAERFIPDPCGDGERLYRTGDLARYRPDGTIDYLGRIDHQVKIRGQRIELGEIETVLTEHPDVDGAAVTVHDGRLAAYLTPETLDVDAVRRFLRERLTDAMVPTHWTTLVTLPLTTSGKVDRKALPAPAGHLTTRAYVAPRTDLERTVAAAVAASVGVDTVGVHDRFFDLGGDSMRAIRVVGLLREQGIGLSVTDMYTHQSVGELATLLADPATDTTPEELAGRFTQLSDEDRALLPEGLVDAYPMAQTQAGMVYEMLAAAGRAVYQNVSCYRILDKRPFSIETLRQAAAILVSRHEILRTSFDLSTYSRTMQLVHATAELPVGHDDLRGRPDPEAAVRAFLVAQREERFDIARPPLLRYHAHRISDDEWWLTHIECHAILDGWSHTGVVAELLDIYRMLRDTGGTDLAPPPAVRFADFVALEQRALDSPATREFWSSRLREYERFELPETWGSDRPDEAPRIIEVPYEDLLPGLRRLASAAHASMKSVLHAAHLKALSVVSGERRFFDGLVCNGRPEHLRGDEVRGMYLNTIPFAADVTAPTWRGLVRDVFDGEAALWPHRRYPMPAMQREWGASTQLIDVAFGYLDFHMLDWEAGDVGIVDDFSPSELPLEVWTFPGVLRLGGRPSRIGRPQLELLGRTYRHVLEAMAADPGGDTDLTLAPADLAEALRDDATRPYDTDTLVHRLIEDHATATPDAVALRCGDATVTFGELDERATALAHRLAGMGIGPDRIVGLRLPRGIDLVVGMVATLKAGGAFLPIDPDYPAERIAYMLADADVAVVLDEESLAATGGAATGGAATGGAATGGATGEPAGPGLDGLAYVIYTSGSTGRPKGVGVPHRGALNLRHAQGEHLDVRAGDRVLQFASPSFDASVWELLMSLTRGAELVLPPPGTDQTDLRRQAGLVTHMTLPPSLLDKLDPADFPHLRVLVSAGEACPPEQAARWARHTTFINAYGPTETSVCATLTRVEPSATAEAPSIGLPIGNVRVYVLSADLRPVAPGVPGQLYVGGAGLARGYLGRPALTAGRFVPDPYASTPGARMYATGDLVSRNADGTIRYHGRDDHQVKVRGFRVEPGEIEDALTAHPAVAAAVVTVHRGASGDATLVGYTRGRPVSPAELREHLRERLPAHMVPTHLLALEDFPLTPAGKVDRAALPAPDGSRLTTEYVAPRTDLETAIAAAWREALGVEKVGVHDDFTDLGGHSLAMMRIIATLRASHGLELTFRSFVERRTVAGLAETVTAPKPEGALMWLRRTGSRTPLFCVHPGGGSAHWYLRLAPHLDADQPVAAFEWPGPHDAGADLTAEAMAVRYLTELRAAQPHGPYRLFSWCGGSGVASEMAHRLRAEGEDVIFLLLDPGVDAHVRTAAWQELSYIQRLERLLDEVAGGDDTPERRTEILALLDHLVDDTDEEIALPADGVGDVWPDAVRVWREVMEMDLAYRHRPYAGGLHLIVSDELSQGRHEVAFGQSFAEYRARWAELTGDLAVHRVPGDHFGVMKPPHVTRLADLITTVLEGNPTP